MNLPQPLAEVHDVVAMIVQHREIPPERWDAMTDVQRTALDTFKRGVAWAEWSPKIGVPVRLRMANVRESQQTPALVRVAEYVEHGDFDAGRCLVLTGPTGVGKSFAAVAALRATSNTSTDPSTRRFVYFPAACGGLLDPERRRTTLDMLRTTAFLVLDDFGTEYVKEGGLVDAFLDEIVWHREAEYLPTIITTNLTTDGLKARLPDRLIDRLRGDWGRIYEVPGTSLRGDK